MTPIHQIDDLNNIPQELKENCSWVGFKVKGKDKTPVIADAPHRKASSTDPQTWRTYETAVEGLKRGAYNAIGYALNGQEIGIDLDDCIEGKGVNACAAEIVPRAASYAETSISGKGIHILLAGRLEKGCRNNTNGVEVYGRGRFFICTGNHLAGTPKDIRENPEAVKWVIQNYVTEISETTETIERHSLSPLCCPVAPPLSAVSVTPNSQDIDALIQQTIPTQPRERNISLFRFARGLRHNLGMKGWPLKDLKPIVRRWYEAALPNIRTKDFTTTWMDFTHSWPLADHPLGANPLVTAWARAQAEPFPPAAEDYDLEEVKWLVGLCSVLASFSRDGRFFLSTHSAAKLLKVHPMAVHRALKMLVADGILELLHVGNQRRASRFRWLPKPTRHKQVGEA